MGNLVINLYKRKREQKGTNHRGSFGTRRLKAGDLTYIIKHRPSGRVFCEAYDGYSEAEYYRGRLKGTRSSAVLKDKRRWPLNPERTVVCWDAG